MGYIYYDGEPVEEVPGSGTWDLNRTSSPRGGLRVTIEPAEAKSAGARWRVDGGRWRTSGYTQGSLPAGWHTVEFKSISEWNKPSDQEVCVDPRLTTPTGD